MRRSRAPGAGNTRELRVMDVLASEGWLCASRRHIGGAGDVLAVKPHISDVLGPWGLHARLIEVKSTSGGPYERFGPEARRALVETAEQFGIDAWLYWWPPRKQLERIHSSQFPVPKVVSE